MTVVPHRSPLNTALRAAGPWLLAAAAAGAMAVLIRLLLIEPLEWARVCEREPEHVLCLLRSAAIASFQQQLIGWLAAVAAVIGVVVRWRWLAGVGLLTGTLAAVLYAVEPGLFGALLGLLGLLPRPGASAARPAQSAEAPITAASDEKPSA